MRQDVWYVAVNEGRIVAKHREADVVEDFIDAKNEEEAEESASEYNYMPGSPYAYWQNGYDGGFYDLGKVVMTSEDTLVVVTRETGDYDIDIEELEDAPVLKGQDYYG